MFKIDMFNTITNSGVITYYSETKFTAMLLIVRFTSCGLKTAKDAVENGGMYRAGDYIVNVTAP